MSRSSCAFRPVFAAAVGAALFAASVARAGTPITFNGNAANASLAPDNYHYQIFSNFCGPASIEMQLDSNAWRGNLLPQFSVAGIQNQGFSQGNLWTVSNGTSGPGWSSDPNGVTNALNAATGNVGAFIQNDDATLNIANRNIANALELTGTPVTVLINHSAHWIDVYGVVTDVAPAVNGAYTIKGFLIRDPWPVAGTLGPNTYLANNARAWGRYFNTAAPQAAAPWSGKYVSITDPPASDLGLFDSLPSPFPDLPSPITDPTVAANDAASDTTANTEFNGDEQPGGNFTPADSLLEHFTGDSAAQGDWLVPYEDASGVGGFELIDENTGQIDQATWFDPGSEISLDQMFADVNAELSGNLVFDGAPEPASLSLLVLGTATLLTRRRRKGASKN